MQAKGFQVESRLAGRADTSDTRLSEWMETDHSGPMLETVMLGLRMRGSLSDHDRNILDWLFGESQVAFLIRDGVYLHPDGVPLLPEGALYVPPLHNPGAVFTQRLSSLDRPGEGRGLLRAARLSREDEPELIIGCLGGDDSADRRATDDRFARLFTRFRDAWERAGRIEATLRRRVDENEPFLIICRASGRVVKASRAMIARLGGAPLEGREYSEVAGLLTAALNGAALGLDNVRLEDIFLCVATLRTRSTATTVADDSPLADFFVHKMKNKLSSIVAASSHLGELLPRENDFAELLEVIASESANLDGYLDRMSLLGTARERRHLDVGIMDSLRAAVEKLTSAVASRPDVEFRGIRTERKTRTVPQGLPLLFDAILRAHRVTHRDHQVTAIRIGETDTATTVSVFTERRPGASGPASDANWHEYATRLAEMLGLTYYRRNREDTAAVSSMVEIAYHQEAGRHDR